MSKIKPLADEFVKVIESPDSKDIYCGSPGLARCPNGRLIATTDFSGPGVFKLKGPKAARQKFKKLVYQGKVFTSDDNGKTWIHRIDFSFLHARPFVSGVSLYVLGQADDLMVIRSDDWGDTWSSPVQLTHGETWHQAPCNVHYANGCVYLVMEHRVYQDIEGWNVNGIAPILMRGKTTADLTKQKNWAFASVLVFRDAVPQNQLNYFGVPFYEGDPKKDIMVAPGRYCSPIGWLESNVVQILDPNHYWYDSKGKTFHLWMRAHTGSTGYAAIAKVVEQDDGSMITMLETVPSGKKIVYVPCPGGQMKFHILYDGITKLYWLLSSQATDSMTRAEKLSKERYDLPNNERRRLQLHFSKNMIDWCFAGLVAVGEVEKASRHYASMVIDGNDLHVLSRSGDQQAKSAHDGNLISFHTVRHFRELVY